MLPDFLVAETTVRESGEGVVFDSGAFPVNDLFLTLGITHAIEQESIDVEIYGSADGLNWPAQPLSAFPAKFYCGTYQLVLHSPGARYFKTVWKVRRWSRGDNRPYFSFYIFGRSERARAMAGAA
jgi:hypothetical protein